MQGQMRPGDFFKFISPSAQCATPYRTAKSRSQPYLPHTFRMAFVELVALPATERASPACWNLEMALRTVPCGISFRRSAMRPNHASTCAIGASDMTTVAWPSVVILTSSPMANISARYLLLNTAFPTLRLLFVHIQLPSSLLKKTIYYILKPLCHRFSFYGQFSCYHLLSTLAVVMFPSDRLLSMGLVPHFSIGMLD